MRGVANVLADGVSRWDRSTIAHKTLADANTVRLACTRQAASDMFTASEINVSSALPAPLGPPRRLALPRADPRVDVCAAQLGCWPERCPSSA